MDITAIASPVIVNIKSNGDMGQIKSLMTDLRIDIEKFIEKNAEKRIDDGQKRIPRRLWLAQNVGVPEYWELLVK